MSNMQNLPIHGQGQGIVCSQCDRTGHTVQDCPYVLNNRSYCCSNCGTREISRRQCGCRGCQEPGCTSQESSWLHPHNTSALSVAARTSIRGRQAALRGPSNVQNPNPTTVHDNYHRQTQPVPTTTFPTLPKYQADKSLLSNYNGPTVITNYVRLHRTPDQVHEYRVELARIPLAANSNVQAAHRTISQRSERKRVFNALATMPPLQGHSDYATDYETLWSLTPLTTTQLRQVNVQYTKQSGEQATVPFVEFHFLRTLTFANGSADLVGKTTEGRDPNLLIKALNGMVTQRITQGQANALFEATANKFYLKHNSTDLGALLIQRGYFSSIRPGQQSVLLNVSITHSTFIKPILVTEFLRLLNHPSYGCAQDILKGKMVRITYDRGIVRGVNKDLADHRKKRITGFGKIPQLQEFYDGTRKWTVKEWFESQGLQITQVHRPCVNVGLPEGSSGGQLWIPPEYLELEPHQPFSKKLNSGDMHRMLGVALRHPAANQIAINDEGLRFLGVNGNAPIANDLGNNLGLQTGTALLEVPGKLLPAPIVQYRATSKDKIVNASWDIRNDRMVTAPTFKVRIGVLDLREGQTELNAVEVGNGFLQRCIDHGVLQSTDKGGVEVISAQLPAVRGSFNLEAFKQYKDIIAKECGSKDRETLVLILLDKQDNELYPVLKRIADCSLGLKTIFCTNQKLKASGNDALFSNLVLKANIKAGGQNHHVRIGKGKAAQSAFHKIGESTLVIGVDVVHPGGDLPSIASMVGSIDKQYVNFAGSVRLQPARQEILTVNNVTEMFLECLMAFGQGTQQLPQRILYYRDGVSEDQYHQVLEQEVASIRQAYLTWLICRYSEPQRGERSKSSRSPEIPVSAIVVGKRHHTRFFSRNDAMSYRDKPGGPINGNIKPGLVVDQVITQTGIAGAFPDFFLQSHAALRGTAKSAHYVVICNDNAIPMSDIQNITHAFCYDYARATKGVSYCAPAYYADRLCDRAHKYLNVYLNAFMPSLPQKTQAENDNGRDGVRQYQMRIRNLIADDPNWHNGRKNPWDQKMDDIMFWL